jgi:hypothetical protein
MLSDGDAARYRGLLGEAKAAYSAGELPLALRLALDTLELCDDDLSVHAIAAACGLRLNAR